ncbi:MAG: SBBP repeat-containing protein [Promethearchaeota archaeon]
MKKGSLILSLIILCLMSPFWICHFITYPSLPIQSEITGSQLSFSDLNNKIQEDVKDTLTGFGGGFLSNPYSEDIDYTLRGSQVTMGFGCNSIQLFFSSEDLSSPEEVYITFPGSSPVVPFANEPTGVYSNYFFGSNPEDWVINSPYYSQLIYRELYPNIDLIYYLTHGMLKYEFIVHPGGQVDDIRIQWYGSVSLNILPEGLEITITHQEDQFSLVDTSPVCYLQETKESISGGFIIYDPQSYGFSVLDYDLSQTLVIDPELTMSTFLGSSGPEYGYSIALDTSKNIFVTGIGGGLFPTTSGAYNTTPNGGWDVFISKLSPNGQKLLNSTFIGGSGNDYPYAMALDDLGNVYITGMTENDTVVYPTTPNAFNRTHSGGPRDAFITKLSADFSQLLFSTLIGGNADDYAYSIAIDSSYNVIVTGYTYDWEIDFPTTPNAYDTTHNGLRDVFVVKLAANGTTLLFSTFIGGANHDYGRGIALDSSENIVIAGVAGESVDFPTTPGAYNTTHNGGGADAFITKLAPNGSTILCSTFFGGTYMDYGYALALDMADNIYITGYTLHIDTPFPTTPDAYDRTRNGYADVFVAKFSADCSTLLYSTLIGGSASDIANSIDVDDLGSAFITGYTQELQEPGIPFPTTRYFAFDTSHNGDKDVFLSQISANGSKLLYSTLLGGTMEDEATSIVVDNAGSAYITGWTEESEIRDGGNYPNTSYVFSETHNGDVDVFISRIRLLPRNPDAPRQLSAAVSLDQKVVLLWADVFEGFPDVNRYWIYRRTESGVYTWLDSSYSDFYVDDSVMPGLTYYYVVSAVNPIGESLLSEEVIVEIPEFKLNSNPSSTSISSPSSETSMIISSTSKKSAEASDFPSFSLIVLTIITTTIISRYKRRKT